VISTPSMRTTPPKPKSIPILIETLPGTPKVNPNSNLKAKLYPP